MPSPAPGQMNVAAALQHLQRQIDQLARRPAGGDSNHVGAGLHSLQVGEASEADGANSTAVGYGTYAPADFATSVGSGNSAEGVSATSIGNGASAAGARATAAGYGASAAGTDSGAFGAGASATGARSLAFGNATATAPDSAVMQVESLRLQPEANLTASVVIVVNADGDAYAIGVSTGGALTITPV